MMDLDTVRKAIDSLEGFPGQIGLMGGDPSLHPQFLDILDIWDEMIPNRRQRSFWTAGWRWKKYENDIYRVFDPDLVHYNDHTQTTGKHQPLLVAIEEIVPDKKLREELIDNCWVQRQWSASITPKGAFFCEVAASLHHLFDGPGGWPIEKGWWKRIPSDYTEQRDFACNKCSAALPMPAYSDARGGREESIDVVSKGNLERLKKVKSPKVKKGGYEIWDRKMDRGDIEKIVGWNPSKFRDFEAHNPEDVEKNVK